ncbi:MAG: hypothetical protein Q9186_000693 [Xanthomendoza sp. 1 TL-2023]
MDFQQPYRTPDLAAVLQTLAAYTPSKPPPPPPPHQAQQQIEDDLEEGEYDPSDFIPIPPTTSPTPFPQVAPPPLQHTYPNPPLQPTPTLPTNRPAPPSATSTPSTQSLTEKASLITTYPTALRHTTHLLTTHPSITTRIRHLIHTAHTHERQWFTGRETLLKQLSSRSESRRKIDSVLASIGGNIGCTGEKTNETPVDMEKELRVYDRKVLKAYREMIEATGRDLGKLGIPFYCIKEELVISGTDQEGAELVRGKIREEELEGLKGRMVAFLEDMVRE